MREYVKQAKDFLKSCNATMDIMYLGTEVNKDWDEKRERDTYMVNIRTPKGNMQVKFWDSINMSPKVIYSKVFHAGAYLSFGYLR